MSAPLNLSDWDAPEEASKPPATVGLNPMPRRKSEPEARANNVTDRLPPHSIEAEQGVLGCVFLDAHECLNECVEKFKDGSVVFYDFRHQTIYDLLVEMHSRKEAIDVITVQQRLKDKSKLEDVGGIAYLASLPDTTPSAANLSFYVNIVREKHTLRKMIRTCADVIGRAYEHQGEVDGLLDEFEHDALAIRSGDDTADTPIKELVCQSIETMESLHTNKGKLLGLSTGFPDLDKLTTGLHGGDLTVIAARPSVGKTSLAMNIAESVAIDQGHPVGIISLEMSKASLVMRMLCSRARVNVREISEGHFVERDFPKITYAASQIARSNIHITDIAGLSIQRAQAKARRMWQQFGIKLFVIDYLQLMHSTSRQAQGSREREVAEISAGCKAIAKDCNVPVVILAQLNRELEKLKIKRPTLAHLRESGAIEQDADTIGLLYNPGSDSESCSGVAVDLDIAKQRNGPTGTVHLTFLKNHTRFESAAKISNDDVENAEHPLLETVDQ